jgi:hypothetical protein
MRIVTELGAAQLSARQLHARLPDVPQATLYRHVRALCEAGVLETAEAREVRGATEHVLRLAPGGARLGAEDVRGLSPRAYLQAFTAFTGGLVETLARALKVRGARRPAPERISFLRGRVWLTPAEEAELRERLATLAREAAARPPGPGRRPLTLAFISLPEEEP